MSQLLGHDAAIEEVTNTIVAHFSDIFDTSIEMGSAQVVRSKG
jgi:hypothetical protein